MGKIQNFIASAFKIEQQMNQTITIYDTMTHELSVFRNLLWYRGDASELHQFYTGFDDFAGNTKFWRGQGTTGVNIRKIHTGLPSLIVDRIADIVLDDMNEIEFPESVPDKTRWDEISKEYNFTDLVKNAVKVALCSGDGAFKISYDPDLSEYPIIEFYGADRVRFEQKRGRLQGIVFKTERVKKDRKFVLLEKYGRNGVSYELLNSDGKNVTVSEIEDFSDLLPIQYTNNLIWAVPLMFEESPKFPGRGKSLYDTKSDAFDAFDEVFSQWMDALRDNRTKTYIPDTLIPIGVDGRELRPNSFDNRYIKTDSQGSLENKGDQITVESGNLQADALLATYVTTLDLCLQGIISPSTLGIDVKKLDNAESQREKEKATLYTRNRIVRVLEEVIPKLIQTIFATIDTLEGKAIAPVKAVVTFGEYANPSFEAVVETVGKAKQYGIMSLDRCVREMYGDSLDEKEILAEVTRIKEESGLSEATTNPLMDTQPKGAASITSLNGAQAQSVLKVTEQLKAGTVSRDGAIALLTSTLGISRENAQAILQEQLPDAGQS